MVAFATPDDVEQRLRRPLTSSETEFLPGMIEEAQLLVVAYLGCGSDPYPEGEIPDAVRVVTSRMVARVIAEGDAIPAEQYGATQVGLTAGPFSQQATFAQGSRTGAPWMTRVDRESLAPYRCSGKAFSIDTAPSCGIFHDPTCSAVAIKSVPHWRSGDCTCGARLAGVPTPGVGDE